MVLSPKKGISQIIIYQVARPSTAETALLTPFELAQFLSYNKAIAFYYSKIILLLSFLQDRSETAVAGHCYGKKGSEESHTRTEREGIWSEQREKTKMNKSGESFKQKQASEARENKRKQTWFV